MVCLEAPDIMREFVDKAAFGRGQSCVVESFDASLTICCDPKGESILCYNIRDEFNDATVYYNVFYNTGTTKW